MTPLCKTQDRERVPELDGIRGLAICLVVFYHYGPYSIIPGSCWLGDFFRTTFALGWSGVDLFFVLSGFLIGGILIDNRNSKHYFKSFYIRRCCRILPAYLLTLAIYLALKLLLTAYSFQSWFEELFLQGNMPFWANLTFTQNIVSAITGKMNADWLMITWTLALEEQFYLVLPIAIWLLKPSWLIPTLLVLLCFNPLLQLFLWLYYPLSYLATSHVIPLRGDALLIGVICAFSLRQKKLMIWLEQNSRHLQVIFLFLLLGAGYLANKCDLGAFEFEKILIFNLWLALLYVILLLLAVTDKKGIVATVMRFSPLRKLGTISYGVYLFHMPINALLHGLLLGRDRRYRDLSDVIVTIAALIITLIVTSLSWHFLESPIVAWGHSFLYGKHKGHIVE